MKTLYIMRHGDTDGNNLTPYGRERVRNAAMQLKEELAGTESLPIYHSCLTRARETAEILAENLTPISTTPIATTELNCDEYGIEGLAARITDPIAILVSHQPDIADYTRRSLSPAQWIRKDIA